MKTLLVSLLLLYAFSSFSIEKTDTIIINDDIRLIKICDNYYIHESFTNSSQYGRFASNGMLVIKNGKALMIDTPFTNKETEVIDNYLKNSMQTTITTFIGGHYHGDCIGGMEYLNSNGVKTILSDQTENFCKKLELPLPDTTFNIIHHFSFEGIMVECHYFGGGHSADNIVAYFPENNILFGGCLIKSAESKRIGNTADAVVSEWASTVEKVIKQYPDVNLVVPGHGRLGGADLLSHTIDIVNKYNQKQK